MKHTFTHSVCQFVQFVTGQAAICAVWCVFSLSASPIWQTNYNTRAEANANHHQNRQRTGQTESHIAGTTSTSSVIVADADGSVILTNVFTSSSTVPNFTTSTPTVGLAVSTFGATATTNAVTILQ